MPTARRSISTFLHFASAAAIFWAGLGFAPAALAAQAKPAAAPASPTAPAPTNDRDLSATQEELIRLLRLSPTLTTVVEHDPSLLANQDYVNKNNPQLGQFLAAHPEVSRNPDFYLFTHLNTEGGRDNALERAVWPELQPAWQRSSAGERIMSDVIPFLVFLGILSAVLWLTRQFLENRRWSRIFKMQTDVHSRMIERFGSSQELLNYMSTDSGKRFLEAAPIAVGFEQEQRIPNAVARVLTPLQIGIVLALLGAGMLGLKSSLGEDMRAPMLLMGTVVLMPGIGFIISAGVTWLLAGRLGLMPGAAAGTGRTNSSYDSRELR